MAAAPIVLNVVTLHKDGRAIKMTQSEKIANLKEPECEKSLANIRALVQYIYVNCTPDVTATVLIIAPGKEPTLRK